MMFLKILNRKLLLPFAVSTLAEGRGVKVSLRLCERTKCEEKNKALFFR